MVQPSPGVVGEAVGERLVVWGAAYSVNDRKAVNGHFADLVKHMVDFFGADARTLSEPQSCQGFGQAAVSRHSRMGDDVRGHDTADEPTR